MASNWLGGGAGGQPDWMSGAGNNFGPVGGIGQLIMGLKGMFGGHGQNPATQASNITGQIPGQTKPLYQPYIDAGETALKDRMNRYGQNPTDIYNKLGEGYTQSPGYKFQMDQAMQAAKNSSAAGGTLGTPFSQQQAQESASGIAGQDFEKYMNHLLGIYNNQDTGLTDITHGGQTASSDFAKMLAEALGTQGQYKYNETDINNTNKNQDWGNLIQGLVHLFGG